ncbi:MAG: hypothetical protein CMK09_14700 [Ponticaulis sp.]|nr:hypothetical protein [Ponticaulis sp.]|tara:strand:- start:3015 stop:3500 length:486 start_codon:yes stop_codon:yes gene_type:complete
MMTWWQGLTARERILVLTAAVFGLVTAVYFLLLSPLLDAREKAERDFQRISSEAQQVFSGLARLDAQAGQSGAQIQGANEGLELLLSRTSSSQQLEIVRMQPSGNGQLTVWFDAANPQRLMAWLQDLETRYGIRVRKADFGKRNNESSLRGNVQLLRGTSS